MKETCVNCEGTGIIRCEHPGGTKRMTDISLFDEDCVDCQGTGKASCPKCKGTGALPAEIPNPWEEEETREHSEENSDLPV